MSELRIQVANVFRPLEPSSRYKGAWGGRGSGKSQFFAGRLILDHIAESGLSSVCIREIQKSLKDSAKRLIERKLLEHKLGEAQGFKVFNEVIKTPGDGLIIFQGLQDHTAESIKSLEGFGRAWVEEAQTLSARSLDLLRPTIRAQNSELWFSWNPRRKTDPVDQMLRGETRPTDAVIVRANWDNNPWFPPELNQERLDCLAMQPDQYEHIWNGEYITVSTGAYYAAQLTTAKQQGRIGRVAIEPLMIVRAFWDIGGTGAKADACAIWIAQFIGKEVRIIDYYEAVGQPLHTHVAWLRANGYDGALCVLPHDAVQHDKIESVTYEGALKKAGFSTLVITNQGTGAAFQRVEAARRLFPSMWFDEVKCAAGIDAIGWYHEKRDEARGIGLGPCHDWSSHGADAFGLMAVSHETLTREKEKRPIRQSLFSGVLDDVIGY
jgi:phage terminase large subunit